MKLGFVTGEYPPMQGGVGAFTQELAQALADSGHQIHIITSRQARPQSSQRRLQNLLQPVDIGFAQLHPKIRRWRWPSLAAITDIVVRYELDLVNIQYQAAAYNMHSPAINFLPWRLKGVTKTAVTFHDLRVPYLFPKAGRLRQRAIHFMARQADGAIVTNHADYQSLQPYENEEWLLRQIPIGSNIPTHTPATEAILTVREQLKLTANECLLGYFGFINQSKGADTLLRALAQCAPHTHLVFIGGQTGSSDPDNNHSFHDQLRQLIVELNLVERVHWTGFVPEKEVSAYLHAADLMVMPYRDGVSLRRGTLMAVLAHGRPLITTTPATPTPELVHGQNVYFVPVDDVGRLRDEIGTVTADPALRTRLGQGAAQVADSFTWDKIAAQTAKLFTHILKLQ